MSAASGLSWSAGAIGGDRVIEPALILQDVAEITVGLRIIGLELQGRYDRLAIASSSRP